MNIAGSCNCNFCPKDKSPIIPEFKNNLGIPNCQYPESFDCVDRLQFGTKINPAIRKSGPEEVVLNPNFGLVCAPEFYPTSDMCESGYTAKWDARLSDPVRGTIHMTLDRPPLQARDFGTYTKPDVYVDEYNAFSPKIYGDYSQINNGQIMYYHDKSEDDPYFSPNFVRRYNTNYILFKDPMGAIKPEYIRQPLNFTDRNFSKDSFTRDSTQFREDLMERQMRVRNQQRYEPRYFSLQ
jgi:hypothetical protein